jgi:hypothetical protein
MVDVLKLLSWKFGDGRLDLFQLLSRKFGSTTSVAVRLVDTSPLSPLLKVNQQPGIDPSTTRQLLRNVEE